MLVRKVYSESQNLLQSKCKFKDHLLKIPRSVAVVLWCGERPSLKNISPTPPPSSQTSVLQFTKLEKRIRRRTPKYISMQNKQLLFFLPPSLVYLFVEEVILRGQCIMGTRSYSAPRVLEIALSVLVSGSVVKHTNLVGSDLFVVSDFSISL